MVMKGRRHVSEEEKAAHAVRHPRSQKAAARVAQHATFVLDEWSVRPSLGYDEMVQKTRKALGCGEKAAKQAIKRAREILNERAHDPEIANKIASAYFDVYEDALAARDRRGALRALDSLRAHFGIGAPDRLHVTGALRLDLEKMSDEELEKAAGVSRGVVERATERDTTKPGTNDN